MRELLGCMKFGNLVHQDCREFNGQPRNMDRDISQYPRYRLDIKIHTPWAEFYFDQILEYFLVQMKSVRTIFQM